MAKKGKDHFSVFDSPYETQPPNGSAEPNIDYGEVAVIAGEEARDPSGLMPPDAKPHNIGPAGGTGDRS